MTSWVVDVNIFSVARLRCYLTLALKLQRRRTFKLRQSSKLWRVWELGVLCEDLREGWSGMFEPEVECV